MRFENMKERERKRLLSRMESLETVASSNNVPMILGPLGVCINKPREREREKERGRKRERVRERERQRQRERENRK